jgi:outer membrane protein insertion porin family
VRYFNQGRAAFAALLFFALGGAIPRAAFAQDPSALQQPPAGFVVESVEVRGALRVSPELVQTAAGIRPGATLTAQTVQELILRLVATRQYESVQIFVRNAELGRGPLVIEVRERPMLAEVRFEGLRSLSGSDGPRLGGAGGEARWTRSASPRRRSSCATCSRAAASSSCRSTRRSPRSRAGYRLTFNVTRGEPPLHRRDGVRGEQAFSDAALRGAMRTRPEGFWWFRSGRFDREAFARGPAQNLPAFYGSHGYIDFTVVGDTLIVDPETGKARLVVEVREGPQYRLGEFNVQGNSRFPTEALASMFTTQRRSVLGLPFGRDRQRERGRGVRRALARRRGGRRSSSCTATRGTSSRR